MEQAIPSIQQQSKDFNNYRAINSLPLQRRQWYIISFVEDELTTPPSKLWFDAVILTSVPVENQSAIDFETSTWSFGTELWLSSLLHPFSRLHDARSHQNSEDLLKNSQNIPRTSLTNISLYWRMIVRRDGSWVNQDLASLEKILEFAAYRKYATDSALDQCQYYQERDFISKL